MPWPWESSDTVENLQEQLEKNELRVKNLEFELSIAQRQAAIKKLQESGLTPKSFNNDWKRIWAWVTGRH
jgi:hypothetical protein